MTPALVRSPTVTDAQAELIRRRLGEAAIRALAGAPTLLKASRAPWTGRRPAQTLLDASFRTLLLSLAENYATPGRINPRGLALALRIFHRAHPAPSPDRGDSALTAALWPQLLATADKLDQSEDPKLGRAERYQLCQSALRSFLIQAVHAIAHTMVKAGATDRGAPMADAASPIAETAPPPLTLAQVAHDLVTIAQVAIQAMAIRRPDATPTLQAIHTALRALTATSAVLPDDLRALAGSAETIAQALRPTGAGNWRSASPGRSSLQRSAPRAALA